MSRVADASEAEPVMLRIGLSSITREILRRSGAEQVLIDQQTEAIDADVRLALVILRLA